MRNNSFIYFTHSKQNKKGLYGKPIDKEYRKLLSVVKRPLPIYSFN